MQDSQPPPRGCGQARPLSGLPELGGYLFNFLYLFMGFFMFLYDHMTFEKFSTFHKSCDLWSVMNYVIYDAATCSIIAARSPGPTRGTWAPCPSSWSEVPPPQFLAGAGPRCPAMVTHAPAIPAIAAPSRLVDHLCPRKVIFSGADVLKMCCGQSTHQELVTSVLTPSKGLEWAAAGGSFPACAGIWLQDSQARGLSRAGLRGKGRTLLSSPACNRSHQEQSPALCL